MVGSKNVVPLVPLRRMLPRKEVTPRRRAFGASTLQRPGGGNFPPPLSGCFLNKGECNQGVLKMSTDTLEAPTQETDVTIGPFAVEADHPRNMDLMLQNIPNARLKSRLIPSRTIKDTVSGDDMTPKDQSRHLGVLPEIPGMRIHVNPIKSQYRIIDPLENDEDLQARVVRAMRSDERAWQPKEVKGVKQQEGNLDVDHLKTLCRELRWLVDNGQARVAMGVLPELETIASMPGEFLLNPGSRVHNSQPQHEKDFPAWVARLDSVGGN